MRPWNRWPLIYKFLHFWKKIFRLYGSENDVGIFRTFWSFFSKYLVPTKTPPFATKTRKCHNFFQKSSKLKQCKSENSNVLVAVVSTSVDKNKCNQKLIYFLTKSVQKELESKKLLKINKKICLNGMPLTHLTWGENWLTNYHTMAIE